MIFIINSLMYTANSELTDCGARNPAELDGLAEDYW